MKAIWNKQVLAESDDTVEVEGDYYFPRGSVNEEFLEVSPNRSENPEKGTAYFYHLNVDGSHNENAAWYYPDPNPAVSEIKDRIAFWSGVVIEE